MAPGTIVWHLSGAAQGSRYQVFGFRGTVRGTVDFGVALVQAERQGSGDKSGANDSFLYQWVGDA